MENKFYSIPIYLTSIKNAILVNPDTVFPVDVIRAVKLLFVVETEGGILVIVVVGVAIAVEVCVMVVVNWVDNAVDDVVKFIVGLMAAQPLNTIIATIAEDKMIFFIIH